MYYTPAHRQILCHNPGIWIYTVFARKKVGKQRKTQKSFSLIVVLFLLLWEKKREGRGN